MKFRKKPIVIDAWQLDISNTDETISLYEKIYKPRPMSDLEKAELMEVITNQNGFYIIGLTAPMFASDGDWIIQEINGEFYPCNPDIFEKTYEAVDEIS